MATGESSQEKAPGTGSKLVGTLFFGVFFLVGLGFEILLIRQTVTNFATYSWPQTEAVVVSSEVVPPLNAERDPVLRVSYSYTFDGRPHECNRIDIDTADFETHDAYRLVQHFAAGAKVPCWVNPIVPSEAVLQRKNLATGFLVLFPLVFVAVGGIGMWATWRSKAADSSNKPISNRTKNSKPGRGVLALLSSVFLLIGLGVSYPFVIRPLLKIAAAQNWVPVPGEVISSRVKIHRGDKGSTYSIDLVYRYVYQGHTYTGNRFHFFTGSSSGSSAKAEVVRGLPAGAQVRCFVDPADPAEAVLERGITSEFWFGLIPLVFAVVGAGGLIFSFRMKTTTTTVAPAFDSFTSNSRTNAANGTPGDARLAGPQTLRPTASPQAKMIGLVIFALLWNGIVSVFVFNLFRGGLGGFSWFLGLFLLPFVAVGLGVIGGVFYYAMALFNPRPRLAISSAVLLPGETVSVHWELTGRADRLRRFQITLEGREEATYRRGTDTRTDKEVFARIQLTDTIDPFSMQSGSAKLQLPLDAMHSFTAANNKVVWALKVCGDIPRWPDLNDEYAVTVAPVTLAR